MIESVLAWLTDPAHWVGPRGIPAQLLAHLAYTFVSVAIATALAAPLGAYIGHTGRGRFLVVNLVGGFRAIPSLGVLYLSTLIFLPRLAGDAAYLVPSMIVFVLLAIPPILSGTYAGIGAVDPAARDAARGMGMTSWQQLLRVELPCALPLVISGIRAATVQVVATATMAAVVSLGGLGRFLIDGLASREYEQMAGGALLVALLALTLDVALVAVQRLLVSPGLQTRAEPGGSRRRGLPSEAGSLT
ncbi:MAG: ABC transporter permease [Beutenbergiaceae bacterium]